MIHDDSILARELTILKSQDRMAKIIMDEDEKNHDKPRKDKNSRLFSMETTLNQGEHRLHPFMIKTNTTIH
jgi:hypothetical protein